jgi:hypothetical protein
MLRALATHVEIRSSSDRYGGVRLRSHQSGAARKIQTDVVNHEHEYLNEQPRAECGSYFFGLGYHLFIYNIDTTAYLQESFADLA